MFTGKSQVARLRSAVGNQTGLGGDNPEAVMDPLPSSPVRAERAARPLGPSAPAARPRSRAAPAAAERELAAHRREKRLPSSAGLEDLVAAELRDAQAIEPRVSRQGMQQAVLRAQRAAQLRPVRQNALFGFNRVIDA